MILQITEFKYLHNKSKLMEAFMLTKSNEEKIINNSFVQN